MPDKNEKDAAEKEVTAKEKAAQKAKEKAAKAAQKAKEKAARIAKENAAKAKKVPVFSIPAGDPYVDGVVRHIAKQKSKIDVNARPLVIPANDAAALPALKNYMLRASGAGDSKRFTLAGEAIKTFEAFGEK